MADDWDDWGDDDGEAAAADGGDNSSSSDKSEGWDWPVAATTKPPGATIANQQSRQDENSAVEREAREAVVAEMTENFFIELRSYLENLADPSVREEINQVRFRIFHTPHCCCTLTSVVTVHSCGRLRELSPCVR